MLLTSGSQSDSQKTRLKMQSISFLRGEERVYIPLSVYGLCSCRVAPGLHHTGN
jgi:hypothetical protein